MQLCKFRDMDKCAQKFCDFWDEEEHMCAYAVELHRRISILKKLDDVLADYSFDHKESITEQIKSALLNVGITMTH